MALRRKCQRCSGVTPYSMPKSQHIRQNNTYAKTPNGLQRVLYIQQIIHNFFRPHFTTKTVPAVAIGILGMGMTMP